MLKGVSSATKIQVGCIGAVAWLKVEGPATHQSSGCMREFLHGRFAKGYRIFVVDLEHCPGIDSTFIGMLYAFARQLDRGPDKGSLDVINASERNERSIRKLGLDHCINIAGDDRNWRRERELVRQNLNLPDFCGPLSRRERAEVVLEAHEALIAANEENERRFCDVVEFLRREMEAEDAVADRGTGAGSEFPATSSGARGAPGRGREK